MMPDSIEVKIARIEEKLNNILDIIQKLPCAKCQSQIDDLRLKVIPLYGFITFVGSSLAVGLIAWIFK